MTEMETQTAGQLVEPAQKKKRGRNCKINFTQYNKEKKVAEPIESSATFHCWGSRPAKDEEKKISKVTETVGICELPNGQIRLVRPERIQFTDGGQ